MAMYTFSCPSCGWKADLRGRFDVHSVPCAECGTDARRAEVYAINFKGFTQTPLDQQTYYQEFRDFKEAGAELEYAHSRAEEAAGKQLPTPPLARIAKARAKDLIKKGVKSSEDLKSRTKH